MASRRPETLAKRARELALKERRERKKAKKADAAAARVASPAETEIERVDDAPARGVGA